MSLTRVARRQSFYLRQPLLHAETGLPAPGAEFSPEGARYHYELESYFEGEPGLENGMVVNLSALDSHLEPWLRNPIIEAPARFLHRLAARIIAEKPTPGARLVKLRL